MMRTRLLVTVLAYAAGPVAAQAVGTPQADPHAALAACRGAADAGREAEANAAATQATAGFRTAAKQRPLDPEPLVGQARVLSECAMPFAGAMRKGGLYAQAVKLLEQALALDSTHWAARYTLALNHYHAPQFLGRTAEAIRQFEILLAQQGNAAVFPEQAAPYAYLGDLYRRSERADDAERVWRRGAALFPADERLRRRLVPLGQPAAPPPPSRPAQTPVRFDHLVREDFFVGLVGDSAAMQRAMALCEDTLARNPDHAEALVWHGSGLLYRAGEAFARSDMAGGEALWTRGMAEMDRAAALEPANVGVLIPRAATLLAASRQWPVPADAKRWLEQAAADFEATLRLQQPYFGHLTVHARCELLAGVAEARHRLAENAKARGYNQRIVKECAGTEYAAEAAAWLEGKNAANARTCQGCHVAREGGEP